MCILYIYYEITENYAFIMVYIIHWFLFKKGSVKVQ